MSSLKEQMYEIHEDTDFVENNAGITVVGEFRYTHGGIVRPGLEYHIHYTKSKREVYMTGGVHTASSKIIEKIRSERDKRFKENKFEKTIYGRYSDVKNLNRDNYPKKISIFPSDSDYRVGTITRYFAQKANNTEDDLFEISEEDSQNTNPLFRYLSFEWRISGTRQEVFRDNQRTIDSLIQEVGNKTLENKLRPLRLWKAEEGSKEDIENKLDLLKTF
mgnify:FL=1